jgi:hypothetical protein
MLTYAIPTIVEDRRRDRLTGAQTRRLLRNAEAEGRLDADEESASSANAQ